ncbi:MAG: hypothetical protein Q9217_000035 [Psora testacea]
MPRGNAAQSKVHYQGKEEDFVIMVDDIPSVQNWKKDKSIPLAQVVSGFKIFVTHKYIWIHPLLDFLCATSTRRLIQAQWIYETLQANVETVRCRHGAQNAYDGASKQLLENEFGTSDEDECMKKILEGGTLQETETSERQGPKNETMGPRQAH